MMAEFKNEFSWSKTRDDVFKTCPRQYWFSYYGYWNGWLENAPERTRKIYVLKNLKNRHIWAGEKFHECIQRSLNNIRRGIKVLSVDEIVTITLDQMRTEFRSSKLKNYWKSPKTCGLFTSKEASETCSLCSQTSTITSLWKRSVLAKWRHICKFLLIPNKSSLLRIP